MIRTASFSRDGRYRYRLGRRWGAEPATLLWIMLNPSTADARTDDPTIRRVIGFSRAWGYDACEVINLFAFRSTDPAGLMAVADPVGAGNRRAVRNAIAESAVVGGDRVVLAWGAQGQALVDRAGAVVTVAAERWAASGMIPVRLGATASGAPRHPLYVQAAIRPEPVPPGGLTTTPGTPPARGSATPR